MKSSQQSGVVKWDCLCFLDGNRPLSFWDELGQGLQRGCGETDTWELNFLHYLHHLPFPPLGPLFWAVIPFLFHWPCLVSWSWSNHSHLVEFSVSVTWMLTEISTHNSAHIPMCRCLSGEDWWYLGKRCEKRGSTRDTIVIAASSTVAMFALMLIVTLVTVYCMRKKYRRRTSSNTADLSLENVSRVSYLAIQILLMKSYEEELGLSYMLKKEPLYFLCWITALKPWVPVTFM